MKPSEKKEQTAGLPPANQFAAVVDNVVSLSFDNAPSNRDAARAQEFGSVPDSPPQQREMPRGSSSMNQTPSPNGRSNTHVADVEVEDLAGRALDILNTTGEGGSVSTPFAQLFALTDAYLDIDSQCRHDMLARIMRKGVTPEQVVDDVVPATARYMGKLWMQDRLSFADVSIGTARLQETVRAMTVRKPRQPSRTETISVLLIVPRSEHHTLGIFVLSEQFRSLGCHVRVVVGCHAIEIVQILRKTPYDLVGLSCGGRRSLSAVRDIIRSIRKSVPRKCHITVGGAVTEMELDVKAATVADSVCSNAMAALQNAKLELPKAEAIIKSS